MARQRLRSSVRLTLIAALLGALFVTTAGVVSAAASITASPGTATLSGGNTFYIPYTTIAADLDVDCGASTSTCSVWVTRNNAAKATEALFTNVTGARTLIPVGFINDGCFNFRLYDSAHGALLAQVHIGHQYVCLADGTAQATVQVDGLSGENLGGNSGIFPVLKFLPGGVVDWDSGLAGGVEDSQIWITRSQRNFSPIGGPAPGIFFTDCTAIPLPNGKEVLYAQNVSGEQTGLAPTGGGPYCFTLYQGTAHATKTAGPNQVTIQPYLEYVGGTANGALDPARGTIYFASGNGATNALVCVHGDSIPGSDILHQTPFAYNSEGWNPGGTVASFQSVGAGVNKYTLHIGVGNLAPDGSATPASCQTGTTPSGAAFFVHT